MQRISTDIELQLALNQLQEQSHWNKHHIKEELNRLIDNLKPINIVKQTLSDLVSSSEVKESLSDLIIGATSGVIAKNIFIGESHNPISKISGMLIELLVAKNVTNNAEQIKSIGTSIWNKLTQRISN